MAGGRAPCCRAPSCDKNTVTKGPWSPAEDARLTAFIQRYGPGNWRIVPKKAGLWRCGKSCRLRWMNYLSPDIKRGNFTREEEETIINLHNVHGNKWSMIAAELPGRTDNEIKNVFNTHLKKRLKKEDPECHKDDKSKEAPMISSSFHFSSTSSNVSCEDQNVGKGPIRVDAAAMPSQEMNSRFNSEGVNEVHNAVNEEELQGKVSQLPPNFEFDFHDLVKENLESIELPKEQPLKDSCRTHTKRSAECW